MLQKIDSKVLDILDQEKYIEVLVYLKDRIEPNNIAEVTKKKVAVTSTTPYGAKLEVRKAVVEALQDQAEKTQVNLLKYIEQEKERGNVAEYKPYYIVNMIYVKATKEVIENIAYLPEVEKIFKNEFIKLERTVKNNPSGELMGKNGEGTEWNIERIGANLVWDELGIDGTGAVIGLIDTGVVWDHPALKEKWRGYDPVTGAINPEGNWYDAVLRRDMPYDIQGFSHGTQVLGTILGQEPDGSNKIGVAPGAKWIAAKAFTIDGGLSNEIIAAGEWMLAPGGDPTRAPDVINNSWGGSNEKDDWFRDVVKAWRAAEIVPVFSVGTQKKGEPEQGPGSIANPGNYPESFAVAATDKNNIRAPFSKLGPSPYDEDLIKPEISAPGVDIRSSVAEGYESGLDGTSMAAPHITGTVALLASANSSLKASEVEKIIKDTATELTDDDYPNSPNCGYGYGLVNAFEAVSAAISGTGLITGRVLVEGEDSEEPVIVHEQEVKKAFINEDIEITAAMSDDISIVKAELLVKVEGKSDWMLVQMQRVAGDHKDGIYKAKITSDMLEEPGIIYKIRARDFDDNVVVSKDYTIEIIFGIVPGEYETDFETEPLGWTFTGDWEWGEPREGVGPTPYKGTKLVGTKLEGVYSYNSDSYLITPPIDLRDESFTSATLRFYQWYETPEIKYDNDKGQIYISDDNGENWVPVGPEYSGNGKEWHEILINLKEYIGSPNPVYVAFRFTSDDSVVKDGWYLDNVRLIGKDEEPPAAPTGLIAEVTLAGVRLSWDPSPEVDLEKYKIYRSEVPGQYTDEIGSISRTSFLDETAEAGKTYYYVITAVDISGNESEYSEEVSAIAPPVVVIFRTNFEDDDGGFTTGLTQEGPWYKNYWEWGVPTSGPNAALTGTKVWATNLAGNYDEYSRGYIKSPAMIIPENVTAALFFDYWIDSESVSFDYGYVEISEDDGATWTKVTENIAGHIRKWEKKEVNLADYSGKTIQIRFCFDSDGAFHYEGWYLDNVLVSGVDTTAAANISIVEPVAVSAETKEEVKEDKPFQEGTVETPKFSFRKDKTNDYEIIADDLVEKEATSGIPADAVVTVLETGCSVRTDPATGEFSMRHIANESEEEYWTLRAEAYGYYPREVKVHLEKGGETNEIIFLETIPRGTIKGKVFDSYYKTAIANAEIKVKEDPRIAPVMTDEEGEFTLEGVLEGSCTLKIAADWFYERGEIEVTVVGNQINEVEIPLKRSLSYEDVIIYDQGQAKNSVVMDNVNDGTAVRFTPPHYGKVEGAYVYFRGWEFPIPGGDEIGIAIFDTDERGNPAEMIGEPKIVNIERGEWNFIDLSEYGFATNKDFILTTLQTQIGPFSPAVGIADAIDSTVWFRTYLHEGGEDFTLMMNDGIYGALMIRAKMGYSASIPEITNLGETTYTNQDRITVEGKVAVDGKVNIYVNGEKVQTVETVEKAFVAEIDLEEAENIIMLTSELKGVETEPSSPVKVLKDKVAPILEVIQPLDGEIVNLQTIHVTGNVIEEHLDKLLINEKEVMVNEEGNYNEIIMLSEGENIITIKAIDLAGNTTTITRKVTVRPQGTFLLTLSGEGLSSEPASGVIVANTEVLITVTVPEGKQVESFMVNGVDKKAELVDGKYTFIITVDTEVTVTYEDISRYELRVEESDEYELEETEVGLMLTVKQVAGFKDFGATVRSRAGDNLGQLTVVFTHLRNNIQHSLNSILADFDAKKISVWAGFNVQPGDVLKIYLVDELTNELDRNPVILK